MNRNEFKKWFNMFIEEKGVNQNHVFEFEYRGFEHMVEFGVLHEAILSCSNEEQNIIHKTLVKIDFLNGDVMHFFNHLAEGYVVSNF